MSLRESLVGQDIVFGAQHQLGEFVVSRLECLDQLGPVFL